MPLKEILVFGGKGGVGKSSLSTATAVHIADHLPDQKVLLISFDVAHNLSDLFQREIGTNLTQLTNNLWGIEPDPDIYAERYTEIFAEKTRALLKTMPLVGLIPELEKFINETFHAKSIPLALKNAIFFQSIIDADHPVHWMEGESDGNSNDKTSASTGKNEFTNEEFPAFDYIIADMPPTGNMVALFEVPEDTIKGMLKYSLQIVSVIQDFANKLKKVNPISWFSKKNSERRNMAQEILQMLHGLEERGGRIADLMKTIGSLRLVTIAEKPSIEEIKRAWELSMPYITLDAVHVNRLIPENFGEQSSFLQKQITLQQKYASIVSENFNQFKIFKSKYLDEEPIGIEGLRKLAKEAYKDTPIQEVLNPLKREIKNPEFDYVKNDQKFKPVGKNDKKSTSNEPTDTNDETTSKENNKPEEKKSDEDYDLV